MIINFFCRIASQVNEVKTMSVMFVPPNHTCHLYDLHHTTIRQADISFHYDYVNPIGLNRAKYNVLICSGAEYTPPTIANYSHKINRVLTKTVEAKKYIQSILPNIKVYTIGWTIPPALAITPILTEEQTPLFYTIVNSGNYENCINWLMKLSSVENIENIGNVRVYCEMDKDDVRVLNLLSCKGITLHFDWKYTPEETVFIDSENADTHHYWQHSVGVLTISPRLSEILHIMTMSPKTFLLERQSVIEKFFDGRRQFYESLEKQLIKILQSTLALPISSNTIPELDPEMLVSVITPTFQRENLFFIAINNWKRFTYKNKEWIIIDDGITDTSNSIYNQLNEDEQLAQQLASGVITYIRLEKKVSIGEKRNIGCRKARGIYIMCADDDDYYPSNVIESRLADIYSYACACTYASTIACYDIHANVSFINTPNIYDPPHERVSEATLFFKHTFWDARQFPEDVSRGEGSRFIQDRYTQCREIDWMPIIVSLLHGTNISHKTQPLKEANGCHFKMDAEFIQKLKEYTKNGIK
jgi:glycosyltransferase involved in cell wall biosynthesis